jgi:hypothetical protein
MMATVEELKQAMAAKSHTEDDLRKLLSTVRLAPTIGSPAADPNAKPRKPVSLDDLLRAIQAGGEELSKLRGSLTDQDKQRLKQDATAYLAKQSSSGAAPTTSSTVPVGSSISTKEKTAGLPPGNYVKTKDGWVNSTTKKPVVGIPNTMLDRKFAASIARSRLNEIRRRRAKGL